MLTLPDTCQKIPFTSEDLRPGSQGPWVTFILLRCGRRGGAQGGQPDLSSSFNSLQRIFQKCGHNGHVYIPQDRFTKEYRGFAFCWFLLHAPHSGQHGCPRGGHDGWWRGAGADGTLRSSLTFPLCRRWGTSCCRLERDNYTWRPELTSQVSSDFTGDCKLDSRADLEFWCCFIGEMFSNFLRFALWPAWHG